MNRKGKVFSVGIKTVYTIGHSTRTIDKLIGILKRYSIELLVDVRRFPYSKKFPWFSRENLCCVLEENGIDYEWHGEALGGYRKGGYSEYTKTHQYSEGINKLIEFANKKVVCIMCAESLWFRCHRRFISDSLVKSGIRVIHIYDLGRIYEHKVKLKNSPASLKT